MNVLKIRMTDEALSAGVRTLLEYNGRRLSPQLIRSLSIKLTARRDLLMKGQALPLWNSTKQSFALLHVEGLDRLFAEKERYKILLQSYGGPSAGEPIQIIMSVSFVRYILRKCGLKFGEFKHARDLFGMWFIAVLNLRNGAISFEELFISSGQRTLNQELLKGRAGKCCGGFHGGNCLPCPFGLDKCKLARRQTTLPFGHCRDTVHMHEGYIEQSGYCMNCIRSGKFPKGKAWLEASKPVN